MERVCASVFLGDRIVSDERTDQTIRLVSAELGICGVVVRDNPAFQVQREIVLDDCGAASGEPVWPLRGLGPFCGIRGVGRAARTRVAILSVATSRRASSPVAVAYDCSDWGGVFVGLASGDYCSPTGIRSGGVFLSHVSNGQETTAGSDGNQPARRGHDVVAGSGEGARTFLNARASRSLPRTACGDGRRYLANLS